MASNTLAGIIKNQISHLKRRNYHEKVLAIVLSLVMVLSLATAAFAEVGNDNLEYVELDQADYNATNSGTAWYVMPVAFTVSYPDDIQIGGTGGNLSISDATLPSNKTLNIKIQSVDWAVDSDTTQSIEYNYDLKAGSTVLDNDKVALTLPAGETHAASVQLTAAFDSGVTVHYADRFQDELTYVISLDTTATP